MLSMPEKIFFVIAVFASGFFTWRGVKQIITTISQGAGRPNWNLVPKRLISAIAKFVTLGPTWKLRPAASIFHALVVWGFTFYLLVNMGDVLKAFIPNFQFLGNGIVAGVYRLIADILSIAALVGMSALLIRRFVIQPRELTQAKDTLLHPKAQTGIRRDSAIVGVFILLHVGFRFLGESFLLASEVSLDPWQPLASSVSKLWIGLPAGFSEVMVHISFWMALGLILAFMPYFPYSKHIHLFFAPLNFLLKPERRSMGELSALDFEDESIEQFGALQLSDLGWEQIMDAYACIMCNRCTEVCPANTTGKVLSPAALEINKRYYLNYNGNAQHPEVTSLLTEFAISEEAVWACTACGACVDICPVGNEPMRDILDIRRGLVLMENNFPEQWQTAFRGMERNQNPWNIPPAERMAWTEGMDVPTIAEKPNPEYLWWVGCAPSTDARAQKTTRAFAKILNHAGVDYAVLGKQESCTGDSARRAGNEYLFYELATSNVELFNEIEPQKIITTCPHCLHTIKNEYPAFGGEFQVVHHTQLINELIASGALKLEKRNLEDYQPSSTNIQRTSITFHDPCYLGRQNDILIEPRDILTMSGAKLMEMQRHGTRSFCCGAGGAQMWKEEEHGDEGVNANRFREAQATNADILAVGCPFCMVMMNDAAKDESSEMQILDIAEIVAAQLPDT